MATTPLQFSVSPYRGGTATADGAVTPDAVVPTLVKLIKTNAAQADPAASYALSVVGGWLYTCNVNEALVGIYYWYIEDSDTNIIADGYVNIADDANTYRGAESHATATSEAEVQKIPRAAAAITAGGNITRTKQSASSTVLVETLS